MRCLCVVLNVCDKVEKSRYVFSDFVIHKKVGITLQREYRGCERGKHNQSTERIYR